MSLKETLTTYWLRVQHELLPWLDDTVGPLGERHQQLVSVLGLARIETFVPSFHGLPGRPASERAALARAFVAKAVFNLPTTILLIEMLSADKTLRRLCGWQRASAVPSEATRITQFGGGYSSGQGGQTRMGKGRGPSDR